MNFDPTSLRIGLGHDTHRLGEGGPLRLGGIDVDHDRHLIGHSDADVLLHAVTDAILGAGSLGDIGTMFPNTDDINKNRCSIEMLRLAHASVREAGLQVINLDCIVFAERPRLAPYRQAMVKQISQVLEIEPSRIGLKSKTGEQVDAVGKQQAIQAQCVALLILNRGG